MYSVLGSEAQRWTEPADEEVVEERRSRRGSHRQSKNQVSPQEESLENNISSLNSQRGSQNDHSVDNTSHKEDECLLSSRRRGNHRQCRNQVSPQEEFDSNCMNSCIGDISITQTMNQLSPSASRRESRNLISPEREGHLSPKGESRRQSRLGSEAEQSKSEGDPGETRRHSKLLSAAEEGRRKRRTEQNTGETRRKSATEEIAGESRRQSRTEQNTEESWRQSRLFSEAEQSRRKSKTEQNTGESRRQSQLVSANEEEECLVQIGPRAEVVSFEKERRRDAKKRSTIIEDSRQVVSKSGTCEVHEGSLKSSISNQNHLESPKGPRDPVPPKEVT